MFGLLELLKLDLQLTEFSLNPVVSSIIFCTGVYRGIVDGSNSLNWSFVLNRVHLVFQTSDILLKSSMVKFLLLQIFLKVGHFVDSVVAG